MRVLIAFDKFKDALTAPAACEIASEVLADIRPDWSLDLCPLADGGEGFGTILTQAAQGKWHSLEVTGPRGGRCRSGFGIVDPSRLTTAARDQLNIGNARSLGVVEMASASGLESLQPDERDPWQTDSRGTGEAIHAAIAAGAEALLLGVGGSATNDLGIGALAQLGWAPANEEGEALSILAPIGWPDLTQFRHDGGSLPPIRIACDVSNPLLGDRGATTVFGPQKGLRAEDRDRLEAEVARVSSLLGEAAQNSGNENTPGAGAAGGIAFGFLTAAQAQLVPGFDLVEAWLGVADKLAEADLVITGEGCFDESSLEGKGPGSLIHRAAEAGKRAIVFAGAIGPISALPSGCSIHSITPEDTGLSEALAESADNLAASIRTGIAIE